MTADRHSRPAHLLVALLLAAVFLAECGVAPAARADEAPVFHVVIVNSYSQDFSWVREHNAAFKKALPEGVRYSTFDMDTKRFHTTRHNERADAARRFVLEERPNLVLLTDDNALRLLGDALYELGLPVVYLGINGNPREYLRHPRRATGVLERPLVKRSVAYLCEIMDHKPDRALVLLDGSTTATVIAKEEFREQKSLPVLGVQTDLVSTNDWEEWRLAVLGAKDHGYAFIITGLYHTLRDNQGGLIPSEDVLVWTALHTPIPLMGFWDFNVGPDGAVGGYVLKGASQGRLAGEIARRVLAGASPRTILPVTDRQGRFLFSRSGLVRWDLTLPQSIREHTLFVE